MGYETSKARPRRERDGYFSRYFVGKGIDIGCLDDPVTPDCFKCDLPDCDGQLLVGHPSEHYDWVYSSHCLEHIPDPWAAVLRWWEVLKPGGHLLFEVPDEDLYEQEHWPSAFNGGHLHSFTVSKDRSWSPASINLTDLIATLPNRRVLWFRTYDTGYNHDPALGLYDRTLHDKAEAAVEVCVQKLRG